MRDSASRQRVRRQEEVLADGIDIHWPVRDFGLPEPLRPGIEIDPKACDGERVFVGNAGCSVSTGAVGRSEWVRACIVGELVGFVPPAAAGALLFAVDASEVVMIAGLVAAGLAEGVILGFAQSRVVARLLPRVSGWTRATATAAGIAWLAGMGGSALVQAAGPIGLLIAAPAWVLGLLSMGYLQARRLDPVTTGAYRWVPVTTSAWLVGVALPVITLSVIPNGWPLPIHVIVAVAAAVAMGATVGAITAGTLLRLARAQSASIQPGAPRTGLQSHTAD